MPGVCRCVSVFRGRGVQTVYPGATASTLPQVAVGGPPSSHPTGQPSTQPTSAPSAAVRRDFYAVFNYTILMYVRRVVICDHARNDSCRRANKHFSRVCAFSLLFFLNRRGGGCSATTVITAAVVVCMGVVAYLGWKYPRDRISGLTFARCHAAVAWQRHFCLAASYLTSIFLICSSLP